MQASHQLVHLWTVYGMLQAFALVLLIGRLLSTLAFQVRNTGTTCGHLPAVSLLLLPFNFNALLYN